MGSGPPSGGPGHFWTWFEHWIYHRKNETFSISKSFLWRPKRHDNNVLLLWNCSCCSFCLLFFWSVWVSKSKITRISAKYFHFSFVYVRLCTGSKCVNLIFRFWFQKYKLLILRKNCLLRLSFGHSEMLPVKLHYWFVWNTC